MGVGVDVGKGVTVGISTCVINVSVTTDSGVGDSGIQPMGVGVGYCPHNDAFPTQDVNRVDTATSKKKIRFTMIPTGGIIPLLINRRLERSHLSEPLSTPSTRRFLRKSLGNLYALRG